MATRPRSPALELFCLAPPGQPGVQGPCRYCQWVLLYAHAKGIRYTVKFLDPKAKPDWFLEMSPKGSMPVARHGDRVIPDSKSIVEYMNATWPFGTRVRAKAELPKAVAKLERSKLTDHLWTLLANKEAKAAEGRSALMQEFAKIEAVLNDHGGKTIDGSSAPTIAGSGGVCAVDLSLVPKLEHTLVAGRFLAEPPFDPFAGGALARTKAYYDGFKATALWKATAKFSQRSTVQFWGDYLVKCNKRASYELPPEPLEVFCMAPPGQPGQQGPCRLCHWTLLWCKAAGCKNMKVTFIDPDDRPSWFLEISPTGVLPVARIGNRILRDCVSIVKYVQANTNGKPVRGKKDVAQAVHQLEKSMLTDHVWAMLSKKTAAEREQGRKYLMQELVTINRVLQEYGGGGGWGGASGVPSVGGDGGICACDLSLVPKIHHAVVAAKHLADFDALAEGSLTLVKSYYESFRTTAVWQQATAYSDRALVKFWDDFLKSCGKKRSCTLPPDEIELWCLAPPGQPNTQGACRYSQWTMLWAEALGIKTKTTFVDPDDPPPILKEISTKGALPVARHNGRVFQGCKAIVAYMNSWPNSAPVRFKKDCSRAVAELDQSRITDYLWAMVSSADAGQREKGRRSMLKELSMIDVVLRSHDSNSHTAKSERIHSIGGNGSICEVDLSLLPKLEHALVAGKHLATPPFDPFSGGGLARVKDYWEGFKATPLWKQNTAFTDAHTVAFWGEHLVRTGKRASYALPEGTRGASSATQDVDGGGDVLELFALAPPHRPGVQGPCRYCQWVMLWAEALGVRTKVTFIDPKDKPAWFLEISPKGSMPVARHNGKVVPDSKSIVEYMQKTWPNGKPVRGKGDVSKAVNRLEKSKLTDHLWTLLAKETALEREEGRQDLMMELESIDAVLQAHGCCGGNGCSTEADELAFVDRCPNGHALADMRAPSAGRCDVCHADIARGAACRCCAACDHAVCGSCVRQNAAVVEAPAGCKSLGIEYYLAPPRRSEYPRLTRFNRHGGAKGPVEAAGSVRVGDLFVRVNGVSTRGLAKHKFLALLQSRPVAVEFVAGSAAAPVAVPIAPSGGDAGTEVPLAMI